LDLVLLILVVKRGQCALSLLKPSNSPCSLQAAFLHRIADAFVPLPRRPLSTCGYRAAVGLP